MKRTPKKSGQANGSILSRKGGTIDKFSRYIGAYSKSVIIIRSLVYEKVSLWPYCGY
ncbi:hypothetical protein SAMN06265379_11049 [Saccharicrinis carchari]|uniref:Uncharacterized protein n=1 Tax=Saccharicrinis carchari TaxID=1168039 RepID=A0A521EPE8_SACCC|nr:hypothetical protein SAMN06265379_11049 [Saccharicrinis carchari]